ncbi:kinase, partial [Pseudomonas amygdali pv. morsprunorum]
DDPPFCIDTALTSSAKAVAMIVNRFLPSE